MLKTNIFAVLTLAFLGATSVMAANNPVLLNGAGATFPYPLYSKWFSEYAKANPSARINYQSIGSGGGIRQLLENTVDFGASDAPMTDEQLGKSKTPVLHIPTVLGAVAVTYNLPDLKQKIRLNSEVLAAIFLGKITKWSDPALAKLNPGVNFPKELPIVVAHRSDGSGTSAIFTDYLSKVSPEWREKVGAGTAVSWPTGLGGKGNEGVTGVIKQTPGSIGYVELIYAESNKLPVAQLQNKSKKFIEPSMKTVTSAASGSLASLPADFRVSITDAAGAESYPISGFTYLLVYQTMPADKGTTLVKFLKWAIADGQKMAEPLFYAPLPKAMIGKVAKKINEIKTH
jgi:phosphate transport system substrate-binding protein